MRIFRTHPLILISLLFIMAPSGLAQLTTNRNGRWDRSFGSDGFAEMGIGFHYDSAAFGSDGSIFTVSERYPSGSSVMNLYVYKQLTNGTPDASFGQGGTRAITLSTSAYATWIVLQDDGKVIVGGRKMTSDGGSDLLLVRLLADGSLDQSFGMNGSFELNISRDAAITKDEVNSIAVLPDGRILASGISDQVFNTGTQVETKGVIVCISGNGTIDTNFAVAGISALSLETRSSTAEPLRPGRMIIKVRPNGSIYASVNTNKETTSGVFRPRAYLIGFNSDGSPDNGFGLNGVKDLGIGLSVFSGISISDCIYLSTGRILCTTDNGLYRFDPDGSNDLSFGLNGRFRFPNDSLTLASLLEMPDGTLLVSSVEPMPAPSGSYFAGEIRRILPNGDTDVRFGSSGRALISTPGRDVMVGTMKIRTDGSLTVIGNRYDSNFIPQLFSSRVSLKRKL